MIVHYILFVVLIMQTAGAIDFTYIPDIVYVPHVHSTDYVVWSKIEAKCRNTFKSSQNPTEACDPNCSLNETVTWTTDCNTCEVLPNSSHLFYEKDMRIYKKACATHDCHHTCPGTNCIPPGETVRVGIQCWMNWQKMSNKRYTTATFDVVSVSKTSYSSCPDPGIEGGHLSANDTTHCRTVSVSCDQGRRLSGESFMTCCDGKWNTEISVCLKECHNNHFGRNCSSPCDCVVNNTITPNQSCHSFTGACQCTPSWTGDRCQSRCENGQCGIYEANRVERFTDDSENLVLPLSLGFGVFGFLLLVAIVRLVWWRMAQKKKSETKQEPRQVSVIDILQVGRQSLPPTQDPDDDPNYCALNFQNPMTRKSEGIQNGSQRQIPALSINQGKMEFV